MHIHICAHTLALVVFCKVHTGHEDGFEEAQKFREEVAVESHTRKSWLTGLALRNHKTLKPQAVNPTVYNPYTTHRQNTWF